MEEVYLASPVRTAVGSFNGSLAPLKAVDLGSLVIRETLKRSGIKPEVVEEVIMGNVLQAGLGQNPARQAAIKADIPSAASSFTVNKVCGSGLKTVMLAAQSIMCGDADLVVAGGMESMTNAPYVLNKARWGYRMGNDTIVDVMIKDGLWCAFEDYHMGITAENVAAQFGITRQEQDAMAYASQKKAAAAIAAGAFKEEIVSVVIRGKTGETVFDTDEFVRLNVSMEGLAALKPAFKKEGTVTAGNASGINDGAAAMLVLSGDKAKELGVKPLAKVISYALGGVEPKVMGTGPIPAVRKALAKAGLTVDDIDLFEANEAFAAQYLAVGKELGLPQERTNIHGGAIAIGHPIGASGARILVTLLHAMQKQKAKRGLATLCIGGGQGGAVIVELL